MRNGTKIEKEARPRGRPRGFITSEVLERVRDVFLTKDSPPPRSTNSPRRPASTGRASTPPSATRNSSTSARSSTSGRRASRRWTRSCRAGADRAAAWPSLQGGDRHLYQAAEPAGLHHRRHRDRRIALPSPDRRGGQRDPGELREGLRARLREQRPEARALARRTRQHGGRHPLRHRCPRPAGRASGGIETFTKSMIPVICR